MDHKSYWNEVYDELGHTEVSWYQRVPTVSLDLITKSSRPFQSVIDVGGGASTLVDGLLDRGYQDVTVLDLSEKALAVSRERLGPRSSSVHWVLDDVLRYPLESQTIDVWHDRAVFHFLTSPEDRLAYVRQVVRAVRPGGTVIIATFATDGPTKCSGLDVCRYSPAQLHAEFGSRFDLRGSVLEDHVTPSGRHQHFQYCVCSLQPPRAMAA